MRAISSTLEAAQKVANVKPLWKVVLTHNSTTHTYDKTRAQYLTQTEDEFSQHAQILLNNADGLITPLDLEGYQGIISYGVVNAKRIEEYSATAPLKVIGQQFFSMRGSLLCVLQLVGIPNLLSMDKAQAIYEPDNTDTKTVKTLLQEVLGATNASFSHCTAYTVVFDSEDGLIDSFQPKDYFRIMEGESRLSILKRLLGWTKCVARYEEDGYIHIFNPTVSGSSYDYEYTAPQEKGKHTFFQKTYRKRLVIPNYITVKSHDNHSPQYSGTAIDTESQALMEVKSRPYRLRLASDQQAADLAAAILQRHQLDAEKGSGLVPMNVGAESYDYVNIIDNREGDNRVGNVKYIKRDCNALKKQFEMSIRFGKLAEVPITTAVPTLSMPESMEMDFLALWRNMMLLQEQVNELWDTYKGLYEILDYILAYLDTLNLDKEDAKITKLAVTEAVFEKLHVTSRLRIPEGTDMYD